jgi:hypothetical protein
MTTMEYRASPDVLRSGATSCGITSGDAIWETRLSTTAAHARLDKASVECGTASPAETMQKTELRGMDKTELAGQLAALPRDAESRLG